MAGRFEGRVVVVVGGNSGIGLGTAKAFAKDGARVVITGRNEETLSTAAQEIGSGTVALQCDVRDLEQIGVVFTNIRKHAGSIDVLFVNAGVLGVMPIESVTEAEWDKIHDTNLKGVFFTVQRALPLMSKGAAIVFTGSVAAMKGPVNGSVYAASKAAVRALGRALAAELVGRGIRVNVVTPGLIDTPIFDRAAGLTAEALPALRQKMIERVPMKCVGRPDDVAAAVLFLASDEAAFITGTELFVDGGAANL